MSQFVGVAVLLVVVLALFGGHATHLQKFFLLLLLLFATLVLMFKQRLPRDFWGSLLILILGPTMILCLISILKLRCQAAF